MNKQENFYACRNLTFRNASCVCGGVDPRDVAFIVSNISIRGADKPDVKRIFEREIKLHVFEGKDKYKTVAESLAKNVIFPFSTASAVPIRSTATFYDTESKQFLRADMVPVELEPKDADEYRRVINQELERRKTLSAGDPKPGV